MPVRMSREKFIELSVDNYEELESAALVVVLANIENILTSKSFAGKY